MAASKNEMSPIARIAVMAGALALIPVLFAVAYLKDDSAAIAAAKNRRLAAQEAQYRQMMYDEIDRRLGNSVKP